MIPATFIQELLSRVDIVDIVGHHVQLKKGGASLMGLCPFHAEKSPSFSVNPVRQMYHCFGCGVGGDAIKFLTEYTGMSFLDAVRDLSGQVGLQVPDEEGSAEDRERAAAQRQRRITLSEALAKAAEAYQKQLRATPRATDYLKGRGLSGQIARDFGLGYAAAGWNNLASVFPHYDDPVLEESGMVIVKDAEGDAGGEAGAARRYDRFRDRIMFPIRSVQGDVIGFGGRVLDRGEPKYLNSPETPVFSKGRELYGLFEGRSAIRQRGYALVVEGYMDVVALAQAGFGNAVATLGTACTPDHLQKLFRFTESVVFSFDGDKAGRRAAGRALETSLPHATDVRTIRFLFLPSEHDPDTYVREFGAAAFEECVAQAVPLSRQLIEAAGEGCDLETAEGRAHMLANAKPLWHALPDGNLRRQLLADIAAAARDDVEQLMRQWGQAPRQAATAATVVRPPPRVIGRVGKGAANLLDRAVWLLLHRSELWMHLDGESHDLLAAQEGPYDAFFRCIERSLHEHGPLALGAMLEELRAAAQESGAGAAVLTRIAAFHDPEPESDIAHELSLVLAKLRLSAVNAELEQMMQSGVASPDAQLRMRELMVERGRLKA